MAESASTFAQSSASPTPPTLDTLAIQTCDDAENLNEILRAYTAFEKLIETGAPNDSEVLAPTRSELSALLGLLNEALVARIDAVNAAAGDMRRALMALQGSNNSSSNSNLPSAT
ncbi:hypothetical protein J2W28_005487 [Variovorax boronicumulans]|uniref:hypothetical protein n=1 Tax=Variovorax boronicumulans TaxID=436515 RepID=UPI0027802754|nr:hypothetical protein [Variovorax boronicumulans]MDP9995067.1 hypothetical protein [Variovorax boronicumulans]MDQ0006317.1 hypothetical protein [Variovorax boronicumulans]